MARLITLLSLVAATIGFATSANGLQAVSDADRKLSEHLSRTATNRGASSSSSTTGGHRTAPLRDVPTFNINPSTLTLSGISAGSAMAVQFEIAFSSIIKAVGTIAGIPYMCSQYSSAMGALDCMNYPYLINPSTLMGYVEEFASFQTIDNPTLYLPKHMTMVFSGIADTVVQQGTVRIIDQMYQSLGVTNRYQVYNMSAEHAWITDDYGQACSYLGSPYINNCQYDFGGIFLSRAFAHMDQPPLVSRGSYNSSNLFLFSQTQFGASASISLDDEGYIYVPTACQGGNVTCHLHVNFHGCNQQRGAFPAEADLYVSHTGLNKWAETNNIVIIYPQTIASQLMPFNPQGCFDWWGYTNPSYAQQSGAQMQVIRKMIAKFGGF